MVCLRVFEDIEDIKKEINKMEKKLTVELTTDIKLYAIEISPDDDATIVMTWQVITFVDGARIGDSFMDYDLEVDADEGYDKVNDMYDMLLTNLGKTLSEFTIL